jgi:hypothetical protein
MLSVIAPKYYHLIQRTSRPCSGVGKHGSGWEIIKEQRLVSIILENETGRGQIPDICERIDLDQVLRLAPNDQTAKLELAKVQQHLTEAQKVRDIVGMCWYLSDWMHTEKGSSRGYPFTSSLSTPCSYRDCGGE